MCRKLVRQDLVIQQWFGVIILKYNTHTYPCQSYDFYYYGVCAYMNINLSFYFTVNHAHAQVELIEWM